MYADQVVKIECLKVKFECSALPEELEEEDRAEDVALSPDAIMRCLVNMLTALDFFLGFRNPT